MRFHLLTLGVSLFLLSTSCSEPPDEPTSDASSSEPCRTDDDCDDGVFCNGVETCSPSTATAANGCIEGGLPCGEAECDEGAQACLGTCSVDADGDGAVSTLCGGDDCDDNDPNRFPGNLEVCDPDGVDEDCNPATVGDLDQDGDGFTSAMCCNTGDDGTTRCGDDCDDSTPWINPHSRDSCTTFGIDDDCDGNIDEDGATVEICNQEDDDCDGVVDEGVTVTCWRDEDGDGYAVRGAAPMQVCPMEGHSCRPGYTATAPDETSIPPAYDCDDADGDIEKPTLRCYPDMDGDGSGDQGSTGVYTCGACPTGQVTNDDDCCDRDSGAKPGVTSYSTRANACGSYDWNCDGVESGQHREATGFCGPGGGSGNLCLCGRGTICIGFIGEPPACGHSAPYMTGCSGLGLECGPDSEPRQQACR